jgi:hypothetical protein
MKTNTKLAVAFLAAASSIAAQAADAPAPAVTFDGYAVLTAESKTGTANTADLSAAKVGATAKIGAATTYVSLYYNGTTTNVLDAYAAVDVGGGVTITVGKFLSYMGYEAFDVPNMAQISYAQTLATIPAYHTGVKLDYNAATYSTGIAVVDSLNGANLYKGDFDTSKLGLEAYYSYKGIKDTTIWFGAAEEVATKTAFYDLWASYALNKTDSLGAEVVKVESGATYWLLAYTKGLSDKWSVTSRVSSEDPATGASNTKYTLSPSYKLNDHFVARAEVSYIPAYGANKASTSVAAQTIYKF